MLLNAIAGRYAQSLFDMAKKKNQLDEQLAELLKVKAELREHPDLLRSMLSPTVPSVTKKSILKQVLENRVSPTTLHFMYVLVDKNREIYLGLIVKAYKELLRNERGTVEVIVQSAAPLEENLVRQVEERMLSYTGKKVELQFEVDPSLIGGLLIRIGDTIIDGSVRHQLTQIHERLSKVGTVAIGG
ncbi:ATP synthase F1 subunit delta [bacterium]|nr:ATP synthase F1 subunit delta [bacterium]